MTNPITSLWQRIETAPKDGRDILAYIPSHVIKLKTERNVGWVKICRFVPDEWTDGKWVDNSGFTQPTHWMPLPDAPKEHIFTQEEIVQELTTWQSEPIPPSNFCTRGKMIRQLLDEVRKLECLIQ